MMKLFISLLCIFLFSNLPAQEAIKFFRHLQYNHVSPLIDVKGVHPISEEVAQQSSHYVFKYDSQQRLVEIINNHYHTEKKHPLASLGVYRLSIEYLEGSEIRTFYDQKERRISNDRNVFKEVFSIDQEGRRSRLEFFDLNNQAMESNWEIAKYLWTRGGELIIEKRYNLQGKEVNVSPYFDFGTTGIALTADGSPAAHFNLDSELNPSNNAGGVASYRDSFDMEGNHVKYSYHDEDGDLVLNQWQFAYGTKGYDQLGNHILLQQFDKSGQIIRSRKVPSNANIEVSPAPSSIDSAEIKRKSLGYLKALQSMDTTLMNEVMNDSLKKVTIGYNRKIRQEVAIPTTRLQMMAFANDWNKSNMKFPPVPNDKVKILGIYNRIASVELISDNWVEYLHLMKLDGEWQIVNLIWQHKDVSRYPK